MSFVAKLTFAFAFFCLTYYLVVVSFAMDDLALERSIEVGKGNYIATGSSSVNDTTVGTYSASSIKDISFIRRFIITVFDMPWWFNLFIGLFNGLILTLLTVLWIIKVVHGNG